MDSVRELSFLQRLAQAASSTLDADGLFQLVITETTGSAETDVCSIYLLEPDGTSLVLTATNGLSDAGVGRVRLRIGEGVTGWAAAEGRPIVVADVRDEPRFRWLPGVDQARFVSMCSVPIMSADRLVGVLNVQTDRRRDFSDADVRLLTSIAAQVAGVIERSELQRRLNDRVEELRLSHEIQREFSELTLARAGLDSICEHVARHAGAAAGVYDDEGQSLGGAVSTALPRVIDPPSAARSAQGLSLVPVRAAGEVLGWLAIDAPAGQEVTARRSLAIEHGATVVAFELLRLRSAAETEERLRGDLVDALLSTRLRPDEAAALARRAARLGFRLRGRMWVLVVEPEPWRAAGVDDPRRRRRLARGVLDIVAGHGGLAVSRPAGIVALVPGDDDHDGIESIARAVRETASALAGGAPVTVGISSRAGEAVELSRLAGEAEHAIRVSRASGSAGDVAAFRALGVERLLFELGDPARLEAYVDELLAPLSAHAERGSGAAPLLESLDALVAEGWNLRATARRLCVHINTLLYRTARIEELTGRKLDDPGYRLALALALRARAMLRLPDDVSSAPGVEPRTDRTYRPARPMRSVGG